LFLAPCFWLIARDGKFLPLTPGTFISLATPIGNLEESRLRALRVLKECDVWRRKDTRTGGQLLKHSHRQPMLSYFQFNEAKRSEEIIERLKRGEKVALITTPEARHQDPVSAWWRRRGRRGCAWSPVPGRARSSGRAHGEGLPTDEFHSSASCRTSPASGQQLEALKLFAGTLRLYESPYSHRRNWLAS